MAAERLLAFRAVVNVIARHLGVQGERLRRQIEAAAPIDHWFTMMRVRVPASAPRLCVKDGLLPVRAMWMDRYSTPAGEILVWMTDGCVDCIEQAWYVGDPPDAWPASQHLVISPEADGTR